MTWNQKETRCTGWYGEEHLPSVGIIIYSRIKNFFKWLYKLSVDVQN